MDAPPSDVGPPPPSGPWGEGLVGAEPMQTGNIVQDILVALQRIERRLKRIEEHLGVLEEESPPAKPGTQSSRGETARARTGQRTSPYA